MMGPSKQGGILGMNPTDMLMLGASYIGSKHGETPPWYMAFNFLNEMGKAGVSDGGAAGPFGGIGSILGSLGGLFGMGGGGSGFVKSPSRGIDPTMLMSLASMAGGKNAGQIMSYLSIFDQMGTGMWTDNGGGIAGTRGIGGLFNAIGGMFGMGGPASGSAAGGGIMSIFSGLFGGGAAAGGAAASGGLSSILSTAMMFLPFLLHNGGIVGHHMGALSADEHLAKLQSGEMVLSRGDTSNLFNGGSARVPGGYRPDSRIFMANVGSASRSGGTGASGSGGHQFVTIHVHAKDANSFMDSAGEVQRQAATAMHRAHRRSN